MSTAKKSLGTIGKCIYCGDSESSLSEEHIIPLSLGGKFTLKQASCKKCQGITSGLELDVLRYTLLPVRAKMNLPTRHRNKRPKQFPLTVAKGAQKEKINVPISERPTMLVLPEFKEPAYVDKRKCEKGIDLIGTLAYEVGQPSFTQFFKEHNITSISETVTYNAKGGFTFARLLAKIAYGFAVAHFGIDILNTSYVLPCILGKSDDSGRWVGSTGRVLPTTKSLHEIGLSVKDGDIYSYIRLFANFKPVVPEYVVVIGRAPQIGTSTLNNIQLNKEVT